jgi:hypothetical protein
MKASMSKIEVLHAKVRRFESVKKRFFAEDDCNGKFKPKKAGFYPDRAAGRNSNYCDSGSDFVPGFRAGQGKGAPVGMFEQHEAARHGGALVSARL